DRPQAEHAARTDGGDRDRVAQPGEGRRGRAGAGRTRPASRGRSQPVTFTTPVLDVGALGPTIILSIAAMAVLMLGVFVDERATAQEAAMKYFLLGAFSLSFLIYGTAFVFGVVHSTRFGAIAQALRPGAAVSLIANPLLLAGLGLILVGFAFKLSFVPFHMW